MPIPQSNSLFVEQAGKPVLENGARYGIDRTFSPPPPEKTMTKTEILAALKNLTAEERLEIIETASRMMREEIEEKAQRKVERKRRLRAAAEAAVPLYEPGGPLHDLWSPDSEPYFDSEEEYLNAGVETNA
ncbi:hypothetical protein [Microcoleus vaginatus]|uniref:hypothetical protein n=1 Tax=Microcoleus vaginatus TaxID=119532 RepID=UPI001F602BCB